MNILLKSRCSGVIGAVKLRNTLALLDLSQAEIFPPGRALTTEGSTRLQQGELYRVNQQGAGDALRDIMQIHQFASQASLRSLLLSRPDDSSQKMSSGLVRALGSRCCSLLPIVAKTTLVKNLTTRGHRKIE